MSWRFRFRRYLVFLRHLLWEGFRNRILLATIATVVFGSMISILNKVFYGHVIWERFYAQSDIGTFFCEYTDMNRLIRQPVNTFTNFVYFVLAIYCFSKGWEDHKRNRAYNLITANRFYSFMLGAISLYTFLGSTLFHSSLIEFFSKMDFSAVYSMTLFPAMYFTHRVLLTVRHKASNIRRSKERLVLIIIFTAIYIILAFNLDIRVVHPAVGTIILVSISAGIYLERKDPGQTNKLYLAICIVCILLAGTMFELDIRKIFCNDLGRISPHSLWHIFNALSIFYLYLYIRSERYDENLDELRIRLMQKAHARVYKLN